MAADGGRSTTYTEALDTVHRDLAVLQVQNTHLHERITELSVDIKKLCSEHDLDHEEFGKLKTRAALIEDKQGRSNWILGMLQAITMGALGWFSTKS